MWLIDSKTITKKWRVLSDVLDARRIIREFHWRIPILFVKPTVDNSLRQSGRRTAASRYKVPNLERGLLILEHLANFPQGLAQSELAAQLGLSKTSVFRISMTLLEYGYLQRNEESKTLALSRKLMALGNRTLGEDDLVATAHDVLKQLRDVVRETVLLGVLVDTELVVLSQVLGKHPFKFSVDLGCRLPLHTAAPGKAILAFLPPNEREDIARRMAYPRFTDRTITSCGAYLRELETVRQTGFALDCGEQLTGIHCVAAPIFNRHGYPVAAAWTTGPTDRIRTQDLAEVGAQMMAHTQVISARLGHGLLMQKSLLGTPPQGVMEADSRSKTNGRPKPVAPSRL